MTAVAAAAVVCRQIARQQQQQRRRSAKKRKEITTNARIRCLRVNSNSIRRKKGKIFARLANFDVHVFVVVGFGVPGAVVFFSCHRLSTTATTTTELFLRFACFQNCAALQIIAELFTF